ncbi:hypothetical protein SEVIR_3G268700v4 [Setaria viridis]|uniref:Cysteine-rich transmembrane domain-containing protein n=1 Tax=Setaria viridis TaxID=4556 RepID=A0A4U6VE40_SETVI|nr:hypothetical protein SEVIR_3G268700v2 [Setaria viridis]
MENNARSNPQPPPGYPTVGPDGGDKKGSRRAKTSKQRGEPSFIEGCIAALCCCWLCDLCCD